MEKLKTCILCNSKHIVPLFCVRDWTAKAQEKFLYLKCNHCGIIFLSLQLFESRISQYYRSDYQPYHASYPPLVESFITWRTKREITLFKRFKPDASRVLEIGASFGKYLYNLKRYGGFEVTGIDISKEMCQLGRKLYNIPLFVGDLFKLHFSPASFDIVIMNHIIEHLYDPDKTLQKIADVLVPGGLLLIKTPNIDSVERYLFGKYWLPYEAPRHTLLFSKKTLNAILKMNDFKICKIWFEKTPNNVILSIRNWCIDNFLLRKLAGFFDLNNYLLLTFFSPLSLVLGGLRLSGRMTILAQK